MFDRFTDAAKRAMSRSRIHALRCHHDAIDAAHMLLGLLQEPTEEVTATLAAVGADPQQLFARIEGALAPGSAGDAQQLPFTVGGKRALEGAMNFAGDLGDRVIDAHHLLIGAVAASQGAVAAALDAAGVGAAALRDHFGAPDSGGVPAESAEAEAAGEPEPFDLHGTIAILGAFRDALAKATERAVLAQHFEVAAILRELKYRGQLAAEQLRTLGERG